MIDEKQRYNELGYSFHTHTVEISLIDDVYRSIVHLFKQKFPKNFEWIENDVTHEIWQDQKFHRSIIQSRAEDKKKFGKIYDALQLMAPIKKIMTSSALLERAEYLLGKHRSLINCRSSIIRLDCPHDSRNSLGWHFDEFVNNPDHWPKDGITIIVFFHTTLKKHGAPLYLEKSHLEKIKQETQEGDKNASYVFKISEDVINQYTCSQIEGNAADTLSFPMTLIHKSGENISSDVRISGIFRYYPVDSDTYIDIKEEIKANES